MVVVLSFASPARAPDTAEAQTTPRTLRNAPRPVLRDRYELLVDLGRGGMGVVYRAHDRTLGRDVARRVLQVAGRVDGETIERFQREARAAAAEDRPKACSGLTDLYWDRYVQAERERVRTAEAT